MIIGTHIQMLFGIAMEKETKQVVFNKKIVGEIEVTGDQYVDAKAAETLLKEKGLYREVSTNDAMYAQANSFATTANEIYKVSFRKSPYEASNTAPFIVNAVFAVELYFKTIHNAYGNNIRGHHLASLYKGMPKNGKRHFLEAAEAVKTAYNHKPDSDVFDYLKNLNKAFEQWRYLYETNYLSTEIQSIRYTMHTAHEACCRVREEIANNKTL